MTARVATYQPWRACYSASFLQRSEAQPASRLSPVSHFDDRMPRSDYVRNVVRND